MELPGLIYEPEKKRRKVLIPLHGNGNNSVFYLRQKNEKLAREVNKEGFAFFTFNNREVHYVKIFKYKIIQGTDHGFGGSERKLGKMVAEFIKCRRCGHCFLR